MVENYTQIYHRYFLKDHLGNIRMILTDEHKSDIYPAATLEDGAVGTDTLYYKINVANIVNSPPGISDYQNQNVIINPNPNVTPTNNSKKVYRISEGETGSV